MIPKNRTSIWKAQRTDFTGQVKILSGRAICDGNCPNCKWHAVSQGTWRNLMLSSRCLDGSNLNWNSKSPVVNNDLALKSTPSWEVSCVSGFRESGCTLWTASLQTLFFLLIRKHRGRKVENGTFQVLTASFNIPANFCSVIQWMPSSNWLSLGKKGTVWWPWTESILLFWWKVKYIKVW